MYSRCSLHSYARPGDRAVVTPLELPRPHVEGVPAPNDETLYELVWHTFLPE